MAEHVRADRVIATASERLLAGLRTSRGTETLVEHHQHFGSAPRGGAHMINLLEAGGLSGRGGAAFPTWRKWHAVASRSRGDAVVVVNVSEGEPASRKDRELAAHRPHLILDGAALAADSVSSRRVVVAVGRPFTRAREALETAIAERRTARVDKLRWKVVDVPHRYVSGESAALVNFVNGGPAKPYATPPRPNERGVDGKPTLIQNAETLAHAALIARHGPDWFREAGTALSPGTALLTVDGAVRHPRVIEVPLGLSLEEAVGLAGGVAKDVGAILLGGYFGTWLSAETAWSLPLAAESLAPAGASLGCGIILVLPRAACGLMETWRILHYLAGESAGQCGPCVHGLPALAGALYQIARGTGDATQVALIERWSGQIQGRGGCHHPDGAISLLRSALTVFAADLDRHLAGSPCPSAAHHSALPSGVKSTEGWR